MEFLSYWVAKPKIPYRLQIISIKSAAFSYFCESVIGFADSYTLFSMCIGKFFRKNVARRGASVVFACLAVLLLTLVTSCKKPFSDRPLDTSVVKFSTKGAPITMDPVQASTNYANLMICTIYDQLYDYKYLARPYEMKPRLAKGMPEISEDGLTYTFEIKEGVFYADDECFPDGKGREVVVDDFVYSMKRMYDPKNLAQGEWVWQGRIVGLDEWKANGADYSKPIEGIKTYGKYKFSITLTAPYPQLIYTLAMGYSSFVPREAVEYYGKAFGINPVGSGPYRLKTFTTKKAVLERNPSYREEYFDLEAEGYDPETQKWLNVHLIDGKRLPISENLDIYFMSEGMARWNSLTKGNEIQFGIIQPELMHMVAEEVDPLKLKPFYASKYQATSAPQVEVVYLSFNMDNPEIGYNPDPERNHRNLLLRKAIQKAYNWEQRNKRFYNGTAEIFPGVIPPGLDAYDPEADRDSITMDLDRARELLAEGGWTPENLPVLEYCGVGIVVYRQFYEQFRGWMEKIGYPREKIKNITYATFGDFSKAVKQRECMLIGMAWGADYPDSENMLQLFYGPNASPGSNNANFDDPEFNRLFRQAKTMQPGPERTKIYQQLNHIIADQVPSICGLARKEPYIWHRNLVLLHSKNPHGSVLKYAYIMSPEEEAEIYGASEN